MVLRSLILAFILTIIAIGAGGVEKTGRLQPTPSGPGVALGYGGGARELDALGAVWYMDYQFENPSYPKHQRLYFAQLSNTTQEVARLARQFPGQWWTFGNEPNDPNQDDIAPEAYVQPYHDLYFALKRADPRARLVPAGVANADWRWFEAWREKYRETYGRYPHVDGWRFHNYLLETCEGALNVDEFKRRALVFRAWMKRIGDDARPVFLTEYGVLYGNGCCSCPLIPQEAVVEYMQATTSWLQESHVVTAWAWFAADTGNRFNGDLFAGDRILPTGIAYQELARQWHIAPK
jgi:putative glycosyl hydrolase